MSLLTLIEQFTFIRTGYLWLMPIIIILFFILNRVLQNKTDWNSIIAEELRPYFCLLYTSPSPRDKRQSRMPSSA